MTIGASVFLIAGLLQETIWARRARREVRFDDYRDPRDPPPR